MQEEIGCGEKVEMKSEKQQANNKQSRSRKNWSKVRNLIKKLKNNELISTSPSSSNTSSQASHKSKLNLLKKQQRQLSGSQKQSEFCGPTLSLNKQNLLNCSEIIETLSRIDVGLPDLGHLELKTYRPIPKINYLAKQDIGAKEIDTTGVWLWEAEEVLAYLLPKCWGRYGGGRTKTMRVLEIGAGCSGLAALTYSKLWQSVEIGCSLQTIISDGKLDNIPFLQQNIHSNFPSISPSVSSPSFSIQAEHYLWGQQTPSINSNNKFDLILAADCLFFQEFHQELILMLSTVLEDHGLAVFVNPRRGGTLGAFINKVDEANRKHQEEEDGKLDYKFIEFKDETYINKMQNYKATTANFNQNEDEFIFLEVTKQKPTKNKPK